MEKEPQDQEYLSGLVFLKTCFGWWWFEPIVSGYWQIYGLRIEMEEVFEY